MINILVSQIDKVALSKLTVLDVRTTEEFNEGNIPNSTNIPVDILISATNLKIDKSKPLLVYCESGTRSLVACQILDRLGYQTYNLLGGYTAWINKKSS